MKKSTCLIFLTLFLFSTTQMMSQNDAKTDLIAKFGEFNFWIGDWNVYKFGTDTIVGLSKIESILNSTAIRETYESTRGKYKGTSLNKYNPRTKIWEQFWIDNGGLSLLIQGGIVDGKMVLANVEENEKGKTHNRITWTPNADKTVRQEWEQSADGEVWKKVFDGHYKPKK